MLNSIRLLTLSALLCIVNGQYDGIFVGLGTANSIVASKLVPNFQSKRFLVLDLGGPLAKKNGGTDYPSYYQGEANPQTRFDIPGEYSNIAWTAVGQPYQITQAPGWQGKGFGGNSQFNGMLFQTAPDYVLNQWPSGWQASDLSPYYQQLLSTLKVTDTPSADGQKYLTGIANAFATGYQAAGWAESDTRVLGPLQNLDGFYSTPYVVTDGTGARGGIAAPYLSTIVSASGTSSQSNLDIIANANVQAILFDSSDATTAVGVTYTLNGQSITATLNAGGKVIVGAGALMTPRLLFLSGIGPAGSEGSVFSGTPVTFVRNNPGIGALYDHVGSQFSVTASGLTRFNYSDYAANADVIDTWIAARNGPYAQYGPVSIAHMKSSSSASHPDVELFVSPGSVGGSSGDYNTANSFQAVLMLLSPLSKGSIKLDASNNIQFPDVYYNNDADATAMANALSRTLNSILPQGSGLSLNFGPGTSSHPTLSQTSVDDLRAYVTASDQVAGVPYSRMIMNHWCGTAPLTAGTETAGGVEPTTLRVRGTTNVHVVDASLFPVIPASHPVATVMAVALKAADVLTTLFQATSGSSAVTSALESASSTDGLASTGVASSASVGSSAGSSVGPSVGPSVGTSGAGSSASAGSSSVNTATPTVVTDTNTLTSDSPQGSGGSNGQTTLITRSQGSLTGTVPDARAQETSSASVMVPMTLMAAVLMSLAL